MSDKNKLSVAKVKRVAARAAVFGAKYTKKDFPELLNVVFALRMLLAVCAAVVAAATGITGALGSIGFLALTVLLPQLYCTRFLQVDVEQWGSGALTQEGLMPSFALFVLLWSMLFTALSPAVVSV